MTGLTAVIPRAVLRLHRPGWDRGNPSKLLLRLLEEGHRAVLGQRAHEAATRRAAGARTSGALTGVFGDGYLTVLREDWPVALPQDAPLRLATLRAATNLTMPDCCVLLAADQAGDAVATFDDRLADVAKSHGLAVRER